MILKRDEVDAEEERLREQVRNLPEQERKAFYDQLKRELRDPDTYAVLNWFFLVGLHHFYLGRWIRGLINVVLVAAGVAFMIYEQWITGAVLVGIVIVMEMWELFRSQIIVQDWNNRVYERLLAEHGQR